MSACNCPDTPRTWPGTRGRGSTATAQVRRKQRNFSSRITTVARVTMPGHLCRDYSHHLMSASLLRRWPAAERQAASKSPAIDSRVPMPCCRASSTGCSGRFSWAAGMASSTMATFSLPGKKQHRRGDTTDDGVGATASGTPVMGCGFSICGPATPTCSTWARR